MARLAQPHDPAHAAAVRRPGILTFESVPKRLRPSAFRRWLDDVPATPQTDDERDAAYGAEWQANPYASRASAPARPIPFSHWREEVASQRHHDAYIDWLADHGLTSPAGVAASAWRWSAFEAWERAATEAKR
ncbi:hypothetical protein [Nocardia nova]|uniref:hypothetical protein n=1 Tax=Nocardia nova TaxID=37330 RepID=UPI000CEA27FD|nr:hypothetical protein [Nocardia nova]PPJ34403.1 hypothetical protein C5E41_02315 [Nocardia nova]